MSQVSFHMSKLASENINTLIIYIYLLFPVAPNFSKNTRLQDILGDHKVMPGIHK